MLKTIASLVAVDAVIKYQKNLAFNHKDIIIASGILKN